MSSNHKILYLHGLESGPNGSKGTWLRQSYGATAVDLDTSHARASKAKCDQLGVPWDHTWSDIQEDFRIPLQRARAAIRPETRLIVGSSFGGAVLTHLIHEGAWTGPCLFIAAAGVKLTGLDTLPHTIRAIFLHGRDDDVVPLSHSRQVAAGAGPNVMLWEIGDGHRMKSIMPSGVLDAAVSWLQRT